MDRHDDLGHGCLIMIAFFVFLFACAGINHFIYGHASPKRHYINVDVFVKSFKTDYGTYKGSVTYDRHVVYCLCTDTTLCMEAKIDNDSVWYNLKPHQIKHYDYVLKSRFWHLK